MKKPLLLFVSSGRTDLKLLASDEQNVCHAIEVRKNNTRDFHEWLLKSPDQYVINYQKIVKPQENKDKKKEFKNEPSVQVRENKLILDNAPNLTLRVDEQNRYIISPVKLGGIIEQLKNSPEYEDYEVVAAVVLNTQRDKDSEFGKEEPFAVGSILAKQLADYFEKITFSETKKPELNKSVWLDLLTGKEKFDDDNREGFINPLVVNRLVDELSVFSENKELYLAICGIGGIPQIKNLIRDSGYFYFSERCLLAEDSENPDTPPVIKPVGTLHLTAEQSFALRASVTKLLCSGDFLGAEAAVRHVEDKEHQKWIQPIKDAAKLFRGFDVGNAMVNQTIKIIKNCEQNYVLPALRAEAALQSRSWVEAMAWTVTFYDSALRDAIEAKLKQWGDDVTIDDRHVSYQRRPNIPNDMVGNDNTFPLKRLGHHQYRLNTMGDNEEKWRNNIDSPAINAFFLALTNPVNRYSPKYYRNKSTHRVLSHTDLTQARGVYNDAQLWNLGTESRLCFLAQPLVIGILGNGLTVGDWYCQLVDFLLENLRSFRFPD